MMDYSSMNQGMMGGNGGMTMLFMWLTYILVVVVLVLALPYKDTRNGQKSELRRESAVFSLVLRSKNQMFSEGGSNFWGSRWLRLFGF